MRNSDDVTLYWISGSPPAWRVMLALLHKGVTYRSHLLEHSKGENKTAEYLAINPRGEVPTLVHGEVIVRESVAIMAYIDRAFDGPALFGTDPAEYGMVWQTIMDFESNFRPCVGVIAQVLLRKQMQSRADELKQAEAGMLEQLTLLDTKLSQREWICGASPTAADCWFYPSIAWVERTAFVSGGDAPKSLSRPIDEFENLVAWRKRFEAVEGFEKTIPPHWGKS